MSRVWCETGTGILTFRQAEFSEGKSTPPPCRKKRDKGGAPQRFCKGVNELQFRIKDEDYFLAFVEQEKRWYVIAPTPEGVHRIPVYVDAVKYRKQGVLGMDTILSS